MKNSFNAALAILALASATSVARADLTINGAVGLPLNPTAQIPAEGGARVQANYFKLDNSGATDTHYYGLYGAFRVADGLEINGGYAKLDTDPNSTREHTGLALGAKYLFSRESDPAGVRLAVGAGYSRPLSKNTYVYAVGSKYLGQLSAGKLPITGHLGLRYDRFKDALFVNDSKKVSVFAGVEVPVTSTGDFQIVGEVGSKITEFSDAKMPYSASVRYRPSGSPFGASIGIARQGLDNDNGLFAQIGYSFGTK